MAHNRKSDEPVTNGVLTESAADQDPPAETPAAAPCAEGASPEARPVVKFGPYPIDTGSSCSVAVWDRVVRLGDGREFTVHTASIQCSYYDEAAGEWKETRYWRGSALPVLIHALTKAHDWILEARDGSKAPSES